MVFPVDPSGNTNAGKLRREIADFIRCVCVCVCVCVSVHQSFAIIRSGFRSPSSVSRCEREREWERERERERVKAEDEWAAA